MIEALAVAQAREHDVTVYGSTQFCEGGDFEGVRVRAFRLPQGKHLHAATLVVASSFDVLASGRFDLIHVHGVENSFTVPVLRLRSRVVTTNHGPTHEREKWGPVAKALIKSTEPGCVKWADRATAVARSQAAALSERYGVDVAYIPNGVDLGTRPDAPGARAFAAEHGVEPGGYALFAAARVDPTKGCLTLLRAWRQLGCPTPLLVVGDLWHAPGHEGELREAANGMAVTFVPRIEDKALLAGVVSAAGVFIFPSTVEAMSMMLLEVMSLGVPVIASDIAENTDVLPDGAWTFAAGDPGDLARAYRDFALESPEVVRERARQRAVSVAEGHSWPRIVEQYEAVYRAALDSPRGGRARS